MAVTVAMRDVGLDADTSWLQTTGTVGLLLSLLVILSCRMSLGDDAFKSWGWRIPFVTSIVLLAMSIVEMFPARIRTTSLSVPHHLGVGILGGFLPFVASALVIYEGNIFAGLWYPVGIALASAIVALIVLPETKERSIS